MTEPTGHTCPECGAPRTADNTPSCDCTRRASDALRETRTAEAAAAEDFDPLRIRPYVEVTEASDVEVAGASDVEVAGASEDEVAGGSDVEVAGASEDEAVPRPAPTPPAGATLPLRPLPGSDTTALHLFHEEPPHDLDFEVEPEPDVEVEPEVEPEPYEIPAEEPHPRPLPHSRSRSRSRRTLLLSVAGAGVAVMAATGLASGFLSYHTPSRDRAAQEVRESVPEPTAPSTSSPPPPPTSTAPASPSPSPTTPSTSPSPTPSSSAPTPSASRTPSRSASPTPSATIAGTPDAAPTEPPVLRPGDKGPAVTELQLRLQQLNLYTDQPNGVFSRAVEDAVRTYQWSRGITEDTLGVYGPATRESLESETTNP